jgi:hypothetical protein
MPDTQQLSRSVSSFDVGYALAESSSLRFAVGAFDSWQQLHHAIEDLALPSLQADSLNCLALQRVFASEIIVGHSEEPMTIQILAFPGNREPIGCSSGPLADCLTGRIHASAASLKEALGAWLVPRHAAHFQDVVEGGGILLWVRLMNIEDERRAYRCLLSSSSSSVGVHDLVALPDSQNSG